MVENPLVVDKLRIIIYKTKKGKRKTESGVLNRSLEIIKSAYHRPRSRDQGSL
jgi:hypothetical protein